VSSYRPIIVFGKGFVGRKVASALPGGVLVDTDIADAHRVRTLLKEVQPEAVVNCAGKCGRPNVDWCERNRWLTWRSNVIGPVTLRNECSATNTFLAHISTGCAFDRYCWRQHGWEEHDRTAATCYYVRTKLAAERYLNGPNVAILRIRMPIDDAPHPRNLLTKLSGFRYITTAMNSLTVLDDLVRAIDLIIAKRVHGIFHCVSPEKISLCDIREQLSDVEIASRCFTRVSTSQLRTLGLTQLLRSDVVLSNRRLSTLGFRFEPTRFALRRLIEKYARRTVTDAGAIDAANV
jgi:3,5-epimerase/4-reductase